MMNLSLVPYAGEVGEPAGESYRECMRNHAAAIGGQAYDGCGEFMPGGEMGSLEALKCAACGCHRNFHRRHLSDHKIHHHRHQPKPILPPPPGAAAAAAFFPPISYHPPRAASAAEADRSRVGSETPPRREEGMDGGDGSGSRSSAMRKRNRTKFSAEQKEKMQAFAERMGWRIPRPDDLALREFCHEVGVERHVLKVWMHNNKSHLSSSSTSPASVIARGGVVNPVPAPAPLPAPAAISV